MGKINMSKTEREQAKAVARKVGRLIPNGPTSHAFFKASHGEDEDLLLAVHLIIMGQ